MSLSNLLHYESDDDDDDVEPQRGGLTAATTHPASPLSSSPLATAAPIAVHPVSHSAQPTAPLEQLEKRALSEDEHDGEGDDRASKKRKRTDAAAAPVGRLLASSSSPQPYVPPPASFFSFAAPALSAPAAPTDLLSILPPPKNTRSRNTVPRQPAVPAAAAQDNALSSSASPSIAAPSPPPRPTTPPPAVAAATSSSSAVPSVPSTSTAAAEPTVAAPPGIRKKTLPVSQTENTPTNAPLPNPFAPSAFPGLTPAPRIAYSTASPYAVQSSQPSATSTSPSAALPSYTSYEEPRMQRQWLEATNIVDVRVDDLTQPPTPSSATSTTQQPASDARVKTTYWDARQGKEVAVWGVAGRQQRTHQINSLAIQAKKLEVDIMRAKEYTAQNKRNTRSKYGW